MKKVLLPVFLMLFTLGFLGNTGFAQSTDGGLPWSLSKQEEPFFENATIPLVKIAPPDYASAIKEDKVSGNGFYRAGLIVNTDIDIQNSGTFIYFPDGRKVWTVKIKIDGALATGLYYDRFYLPKGVSLFLKNKNEKQIVGAINYNYNPDDGLYSTTATQGKEVTVELDIAAGVPVSTIQFHINQIAAQYRGGEVIALEGAYGDDANIVLETINPWPYDEDHSDPCEVNAVCEPEGTTYAHISSTAAHISMPMGNSYGFCSGNLINNTSLDCKPLFLTASHCQSGNSTNSSTFSTWRFYFNYQYPNCTGNAEGTASMEDYLVGAYFKARSSYSPTNGDPHHPDLIGDFILLELKDLGNKLGNDFNAYLGGWDRTQVMPANEKYIDFHFPSGDPKKVTVFGEISPNGSFNGGAPNSHWELSDYIKGGIEGGSSGSCVFVESTGRLIGDLSGGPSFASPCDVNSVHNYSEFSKFFLNWDYLIGGDGTSSSRLKDWLDPAGTDAMFMNTIKVAADGEECGTLGIKEIQSLNEGLKIFPNPSSGMVNMRINLNKATDLKIAVFNMLGVPVATFSANNVMKGELRMDMTALANGIYMLQIQSNEARVSKKVVLRR